MKVSDPNQGHDLSWLALLGCRNGVDPVQEHLHGHVLSSIRFVHRGDGFTGPRMLILEDLADPVVAIARLLIGSYNYIVLDLRSDLQDTFDGVPVEELLDVRLVARAK